jgi:hypothetical protein
VERKGQSTTYYGSGESTELDKTSSQNYKKVIKNPIKSVGHMPDPVGAGRRVCRRWIEHLGIAFGFLEVHDWIML